MSDDGARSASKDADRMKKRKSSHSDRHRSGSSSDRSVSHAPLPWPAPCRWLNKVCVKHPHMLVASPLPRKQPGPKMHVLCLPAKGRLPFPGGRQQPAPNTRSSKPLFASANVGTRVVFRQRTHRTTPYAQPCVSQFV